MGFVVDHSTIAAAAKHLVGAGPVVHKHVGTARHGVGTITGAIDRGLVDIVLLHRCFNVDIGVARDAAVLVAAIDGVFHDGALAPKVHARDVVVAVAFC